MYDYLDWIASAVILLLMSVVFVVLWRVSWPQANKEPFLSRFSLFLAYLLFLAPVITLLLIGLVMLMLSSLAGMAILLRI